MRRSMRGTGETAMGPGRRLSLRHWDDVGQSQSSPRSRGDPVTVPAAPSQHRPHGPIRYGVIGSGWRTQAFVRIADRLPDHFTLEGVVTRSEQRVDEIIVDWRVPAYTDLR